MLSWLRSLTNKATNTEEQQKEAIEHEASYPEIITYAQTGLQRAVREAIQKGVNVDAQSETGMTALLMAASRNDFAMVKLLVEEGGANPNIHDDFGHSPLHWAEHFNNSEMSEYLQSHQPVNGKRP